MEALLVTGGTPLRGTVTISGAKNAVLPILAATVLYDGKYVLHNCPDITDVACAVEILQTLGGSVHRVGETLTVDTRDLCQWVVPGYLMEKMRASVLFLGSLLGRFGRAELTMPGGCPLGRRPIDLHLQAMSHLGAAVTLYEDKICCCAPVLHGGVVDLRFPSVGATENALMAACCCRGSVTILHAAAEPEVGDLIAFLQAMGAEIRGAGTDTIQITGSTGLHDADHTVVPDRIEALTYLCAAAGCGGTITLRNTCPDHLTACLNLLEQCGCHVQTGRSAILLAAPDCLTAPEKIVTAPYPGFPTDAQALFMAALLRADGKTAICEQIFDSRFGHVPPLRQLGGSISISGSTALVRGVAALHPGRVYATDLRAAAALIIATLQAEGESYIYGLKHLDRGYDNPVAKFSSLGARIQRVQ